MIFLFCSGSLTLAKRLKKISLASMLIRSIPKVFLNINSTCSFSPLLKSPLSTKTTITCSFIALAKSAATTLLSTPPLTAQRTLSLPTSSRIFSA